MGRPIRPRASLFICTASSFTCLPPTKSRPKPPIERALVFTEAARAIARQKLDAVAISEIARDLRAAQAEYDLEKLIESIDRYLKQDEWFP